MNLWLVMPYLPTRDLVTLASYAEELGLEGVAVGDHVCVPANVSSIYPYSGHTADLPIDTEFPDPIVLAAGLGVATTSLRFMTYVLLVPLRHPVLLAKEIATAAVLSQGRLDIGVGVGWLREEFDALGVPFNQRGSRMDESIQVMRSLWAGSAVEHKGKNFAFEPIAVHPTPPAPVRVFVGGYSDAALWRAARQGDGWVAVNPTIEELEAMLRRLEQQLRDAERDVSTFSIRSGLKGRATAGRIQALEELGVSDFFVMPWQLTDDRTWIYDLTIDNVLDALPGFVARFQSATDT
jgi:probable F420-dependent oxidoreductase